MYNVGGKEIKAMQQVQNVLVEVSTSNVEFLPIKETTVQLRDKRTKIDT